MTATREKKPTVTTAGSSSIITNGGAFTTIQEIVKDPRATHNCWAYKVGISTGRVMSVNLLERRGSRFILRLLFGVWIKSLWSSSGSNGCGCSFRSLASSIPSKDIKQDYDTGEDGIAMVSFKVDFDRLVKLEETIKTNRSRELVFYKR
ncbi:hypothetical protein ES288_D11G059700v1 [Gossypium darwinii]|uniref:Uncharacterized protein n=1 Tax=Gossypium darwinii TaxID=34276 RepID=A0A5D2AHZ5_GOSDA|nr:hypothetical protein ES288_D11G059700v1 [Gossypium darwinii]